MADSTMTSAANAASAAGQTAATGAESTAQLATSEKANLSNTVKSASQSVVNTITPKPVTKYTQEQLDVAYQAQLKSGTTALGGNKTSVAPRDNPLDAYASYTYGLTLHVLTKEDYNAMITNPFKFVPTKTLISSAGRYSDTGIIATGPRSWKNIGRDPAFKEDFYFDNLKIESVIGLNSQTRGTNAITLDFTIIEPYGMTLMNRIMDVNNVGLNGKNYLDMPYLLEINFFGTDDAGKAMKLEKHTKWIPIKLLALNIKASVKGAEYAISAVPFNHGANLETVQSIKTRMHVSGSTVGEYFANADAGSATAAEKAFNDDSARQQKEEASKHPATAPADQKANTQTTNAGGRGAARTYDTTNKTTSRAPANTGTSKEPMVINAKSFVAAYNAWYAAEEKHGGVEHADQIAFEISEEIKSSSIVDAKKNSSRRIDGVDAKTNAKSSDNNAATARFNSIVHDLEPGTSINDVINNVIPQSNFFLSQVVDSSSANKSGKDKSDDAATTQDQAKSLKMWKIVPTITLGDFDHKRNEWSKTITFSVNSYTAYQTRDKRLPKSPPPSPVKIYDYFYTGHNSSVINFDIDFNALYYTAYDTNRGSSGAGAGPKQKEQDQQNNDKTSRITDPNKIDQNRNQMVSGSHATSSGGANVRPETLNAKSALQSIYTSSGGDMISLRMQIIGDPEFIKQDDLFISPLFLKQSGLTQDPSNPLVPGTQSIDMDSGEVYCYVTFRSPSDFNDTDGMYNLDSKNKYAVSEFSGFYRLNTVTSEFKGGKFTQTLEMYRQPDQEPINRGAASTGVKSAGDVARENKNQKDAQNAIQTANPVVQDKNVSPAPNATTPQGTNSISTERGPDGDSVSRPSLAQTQASVLSAITSSNRDSAPNAAVSDVAKNGETRNISDQ